MIPSPLRLTFSLAFGGACGGLLRYLCSDLLVTPGFAHSDTLLVNLSGSFLIGLLASLTASRGRFPLSPASRAGLLTGFCGGLTTFSRLAEELWLMGSASQYAQAIAYALVTLGGAVLLAFLGSKSARLAGC